MSLPSELKRLALGGRGGETEARRYRGSRSPGKPACRADTGPRAVAAAGEIPSPSSKWGFLQKKDLELQAPGVGSLTAPVGRERLPGSPTERGDPGFKAGFCPWLTGG